MAPNSNFAELFHRYDKNPILTGNDWPYRANSVFNAGATWLHDGRTLLLVRAEDRRRAILDSGSGRDHGVPDAVAGRAVRVVVDDWL